MRPAHPREVVFIHLGPEDGEIEGVLGAELGPVGLSASELDDAEGSEPGPRPERDTNRGSSKSSPGKRAESNCNKRVFAQHGRTLLKVSLTPMRSGYQLSRACESPLRRPAI